MKLLLVIIFLMVQPPDDITRIETLQKAVEEAESPKDKIIALNKLAEEVAYQNTEMLRNCGKQMFEIGENEKNLEWQCMGLTYAVFADQQIRDFVSAQQSLDKMEQSIIGANYRKGLYMLAWLRASTFLLNEKFEEALEQFIIALEVLPESQQDEVTMAGNEALIYANMGIIYNSLNQGDKFL